MRVPFLDLSAEFDELSNDLASVFARVQRSGRFVLGPEVSSFEREFAEYCHTEHCVGVGSGLDALQLLLRAVGVGPDDEVIVPAYTAVATWMAVTAVGATPVGVDIEAATYNIDVSLLETSVTARTKVVIPVHLFGQPADMAPLRSFASRHGLWLFEDAAQAHGARYDGRRVGGLADAAAFSFYPTKNLGALGDGGAVTTDDHGLADRVRLLREYGWRNRVDDSEVKGVNSRLDEVQAAFLRVKLARLDSGNARRAELADLYRQRLAHEDVGLPHTLARVDPVWHLFVVRSAARDELRARLSALGVGTSVHYQPLPHLNQAFRADGWQPGSFPSAERLAEASVSLPLHPRLSPEAFDHVASALSRVAT